MSVSRGRLRLMLGVVVLALASRTPAAAQEVAWVDVDRIVAVVGKVAISTSRVQEEIQLFRAQGGEVPTDSAELDKLRRQILDQIVADELLVQAARRDTSIHVTDQEVQAATDQAMREIRAQFASELEYRQQLTTSGFGTPEEYRLWLQEQKRRELLRSMLMQTLQIRGELKPMSPTEVELREFYERTKEQRTSRPARVSFRQIVIRPEPDSAATLEALRLADSLRAAIRDGADFAELARKFSDDLGTRDQGGDLGWVRRGKLVPEFERVAFRIRPGVVTPPVLSPFGFHVIRVDRSQPAEVQVRHILIVPDVSEENQAAARVRAERVAEELRQGASFDSLLRIHHDRLEETLADDFPRENLPPMYQAPLEGAKEGDIIGPFELATGGGPLKYTVLLFLGSRAAGELTFEELRDQIRRTVADEKGMERYLNQLRAFTYVDIRF